jgi:DNA-binding beta-propeller fold protein YncE
VSETPLTTRSRTVTDIVVEPGTGRRYLVDQTENEIIRWDSNGQTVIENADVKREPRSMRLAADGDEVYVRKASQGEHAPAVRDMKPVTTQAKESDAKGGATTDTRNGINVEVGEDELVVADTCGFDWGNAKRACSDGSTRGIRIGLPGLVDVRDHVLDLSGRLWALGGVIDESTDELTMLLLQIDLLHGTVIARQVDGSVPGDATRQLAPLESGVVLLEGDSDSLQFTRYNTL